MGFYLKFFILFQAFSASAEPARTIRYYEIGKTDGPVLFVHQVNYKKLENDLLETSSKITRPQGEVVYLETIVSRGSEPQKQTCDVFQTKRHLELELKDGQMFLRTRALNAENPEKPEEEKDSIPKNLITGPLAETYIREHLDELKEGKTVKAKMAILEIRDTVTFAFEKKEIYKKGEDEIMVVKMNPSSFFISFLVDTIYLHMNLRTKKMVHYVGRTTLWKEVNGKLKALDAEMVVED